MCTRLCSLDRAQSRELKTIDRRTNIATWKRKTNVLTMRIATNEEFRLHGPVAPLRVLKRYEPPTESCSEAQIARSRCVSLNSL